jgi:serine phosphatase RsbU (regulator of sigma subunit)/predicted ester cyclase
MRRTSPDGIMDGVDPLEKRWLARRRASMSVEENMTLARRFIEARVMGDLQAVDEMMAPDFVNHTALLSVQEPDREGVKWAAAQLSAALSNPSIHFEDQVAAGDKVVTRFVVHSLHDRGELMGVAPTGRELTWMAIFIHRIVEGKIAEEWVGNMSLSELLRRQRLEQEISERERVEQEMMVARRIQQASLPDEVPTLEGWQITPYFQPAREVGGDFYEFFELDDGRLALVVGDATGKGVPAALVMTATCAFLGGVATASGASPGEVLARVNEAVLARIPPNMFVTCFYSILDPESGHLIYANAGHNLPCCRYEDTATELKARGMPLGLMPGMSYEENETVVGPGEGVMFYTDGLIEAHNPQGEMFGTPRLRSLLAEYSTDTRGLNALLLEELERFTGEGWEQEDDITLLTLECSPPRS